MSIIFKELLSMGEKIILKPKIERLYSYNSIINGIKVKNRKMCALAGNTFRAFPRIDKNKVGASKVFRDYFSDNEKKILANLKGLQKQHQFDKFLNSYCKEIEEKLIGVIKNSEFGSFNKIRKPVDITIEHLVAMAKEFTNEDRQKLVPMLRLPLDSLMFNDKTVFPDEVLNKLNIKRNFSFKSITNEPWYIKIQEYLINRGNNNAGSAFYPIYFDLLWRDRYKKKKAESLFETN